MILALLALLAPGSVDGILNAYIQAVGGSAALAHVTTRQVTEGRSTVYWAAPNKFLRVEHTVREGFDGGTAWKLTRKKKIERLPHADIEELQIAANPLRYTRLADMYSDLDAAPSENIDGVLMDVVVAQNGIGPSKFFFDHNTHLLVRIEETGDTSAYHKFITLLEDYRAVDNVVMPTRIERKSDDPSAKGIEIRLTDIRQNVQIDPVMFQKPDAGAIVSARKH